MKCKRTAQYTPRNCKITNIVFINMNQMFLISHKCDVDNIRKSIYQPNRRFSCSMGTVNNQDISIYPISLNNRRLQFLMRYRNTATYTPTETEQLCNWTLKIRGFQSVTDTMKDVNTNPQHGNLRNSKRTRFTSTHWDVTETTTVLLQVKYPARDATLTHGTTRHRPLCRDVIWRSCHQPIKSHPGENNNNTSSETRGGTRGVQSRISRDLGTQLSPALVGVQELTRWGCIRGVGAGPKFVRVGTELSQIGTKWDKNGTFQIRFQYIWAFSGFFSEQISVYLGSESRFNTYCLWRAKMYSVLSYYGPNPTFLQTLHQHDARKVNKLMARGKPKTFLCRFQTFQLQVDWLGRSCRNEWQPERLQAGWEIIG